MTVVKIGKEIGLGGRINTVLQSAFFKLANIIPEEHAIELMKAAAKATYGRKGDAIVQMNYDAIDAGAKQVVEVKVPESWKDCADEGLFMAHAEGGRGDVVDFVNNIQAKVNAQEGNTLPVSAFKDYVDGTTPSGSSAFEKRVLQWISLYGSRKTVSSVTVVHMYVLMLLSVRLL